MVMGIAAGRFPATTTKKDLHYYKPYYYSNCFFTHSSDSWFQIASYITQGRIKSNEAFYPLVQRSRDNRKRSALAA